MHSDKKIKVFLGGYTNYTNAQNLNCRALAKYLNKEVFEIYTLELYSGKLSSLNEKDVHIYRCFRPHRLSIYLGYLWGIWHCEVAYLPKGEIWKFNRFLLRLFRKKSFSTVEGILDNIAIKNAMFFHGNKSQVFSSYSIFSKLYSITGFMREYNFTRHRISTDDKTLYLGADISQFNTEPTKKPLTNILMIGNDLLRKGVFDYFRIASCFPELTFYLAGSGNGKINIEAEIKKLNLKNIEYKGSITSDELATLVREVQLHILPSRSEGFPKVTLETAASGVPSIVYDDYGAKEWITHNINGWVVNTIEEIIEIITELQDKPEMIEKVSAEAIKLAKSFDWNIRVKAWEEVIKDVL